MQLSKIVSLTLATITTITGSTVMSIQNAIASWDSDVPNNFVTHLNLTQTNVAITLNSSSSSKPVTAEINSANNKNQDFKIVRIGGNKVYILKNGTDLAISINLISVNNYNIVVSPFKPNSRLIWEMTPGTTPGAYNIRYAAKPTYGLNISNGMIKKQLTLAIVERGNLNQEFALSHSFQGETTIVPPLANVTQPVIIPAIPNPVIKNLDQPPVTNTPTTNTPTDPRIGCDPSYPDANMCIPISSKNTLNCSDIPYRNFTVIGRDIHQFDGFNSKKRNGIGCQS
jgi:hypothetical protein